MSIDLWSCGQPRLSPTGVAPGFMGLGFGNNCKYINDCVVMDVVKFHMSDSDP